MHTILINTSVRDPIDYGRADLLDIKKETRQFISLDCPLSGWFGGGCRDCIGKLGRMIDDYKDVRGPIQLIVYVNLQEIPAYTGLMRGVPPHQQQATWTAVRDTFVHFVSETAVRQLTEQGRKPEQVMILFEQEEFSGAVGEGDVFRKLRQEMLLRLLGLPGTDRIGEMDRLTSDGSSLWSKISSERTEPFVPGLDQVYGKELRQFFGTDAERAAEAEEGEKRPAGKESAGMLCEQLAEKIGDLYRQESGEILVSAYVLPATSSGVSKATRTKRSLLLQLFLLDVVSSGSLAVNPDAGAGAVRIPKTPQDPGKDGWDTFVSALQKKRAVYGRKLDEFSDVTGNVMEDAKMTPVINELAYGDYGLNPTGNKEKNVIVEDVPEQSGTAPAPDPTGTPDPTETAEGLEAPDKKKITVIDAEIRRFIKEAELPSFDKRGDAVEDGLGKDPTPDRYIAQAKKLRKYHLDYLERLKMNLINVLSHYASRGSGNAPAMITKRRASAMNGDGKQGDTVIRYGTKRDGNVQGAAKNVSENAYLTVQNDFMKFCAARTVSITDIEEQCDWFVNRVEQVRESLQKLKIAAIGVFLAVTLLYVPFFVIQWHDIVKDPFTLAAALGSVVAPLILLAGAFLIAVKLQKRKYREYWERFKEKSDQALEENARAVSEYEDLLARMIPALRYVYEYKMDVAFYFDCCNTAKSKLEHHAKMLAARVETIDNVIEDLEYGTDPVETDREVTVASEVDLRLAYCAGEENCRFYALAEDGLPSDILK